MSLYVLDASVVLKWFLPEPGFEAAQKLRRADVECEAPDLLLLEACHALWKHVRRGAVGSAVADAALAMRSGAPVVTADRRLHDAISATRHAAHIKWIESV